MKFLLKFVWVVYPLIYRMINFRRFRAKYCRFGPAQLKLGKNTVVAEGSIIKALPGSKIIVGKNCYIGEYANIRCDREIIIHDGVHIGQFVTIADADYVFGERIGFENRNISPIEIGCNSFVGSHCCILRGSDIQPNSVIPAMTKIVR